MGHTYTFEDLIGTSDENVPDFARLLRQCSMYRSDVPGDLSEEESRMAISVADKFRLVVHSQQFRPILLEVAVIQDRRLLIEQNGSAGQDTKPYFVSSIVSYCEAQNSAPLLRAWHGAMQRVLSNEVHKVPQPIVPHEDTYKNAYFVEPFDWAVDALRRATALDMHFARTEASARWPEDLVDRQAAPMDRMAGVGLTQQAPVGPGTKKGLFPELTKPAVHQSRYAYERVEKKHRVEKTIAYLAMGFVWKLASSQTDDSVNADIDILLDFLRNAYLVIVPFRRPISPPGTPGDGGMEAAGDNPGGCLFAVVEPRLNQPVSSDSLHPLAIRLSWLLFRAALREAHAEIEVRRGQEQGLGVASHFLTTDIRIVKAGLNELLDKATERDARPLGKLLSRVDRLFDIAQFGIKAWKVNAGVVPPERLSESVPAEDLSSRIGVVVEEIWPGVNLLANTNLDVGNCSADIEIDPAHMGRVVEYHRDYLRVVLSELTLNALKHGDRERTELNWAIRISEAQDVEIVFRNKIAPSAVDYARQRISEVKTGLITLRWGARAVGLKGPAYEVCSEHNEFRVVARIGRLKGI